MEYLILFLGGIITFISPCLLPMVPIYISYFAASDNKGAAFKNSAGFVFGFTLIFIIMGAFAGSIGSITYKYGTYINLVSGIIVILFGLNYLDAVKIPFINNIRGLKTNQINAGFLSSILFGMVFSVGWTPCVSTFLGSALLLAAQSKTALQGVVMLLCYSMGLGLPFIISAVLIEQLKSVFDFFKNNYKIIKIISGGFLIVTGILMATGYMGYLLALLSF